MAGACSRRSERNFVIETSTITSENSGERSSDHSSEIEDPNDVTNKQPEIYTIIFVCEYGYPDNMPEAITKTEGVAVQIPDNTPTRSGERFIGWSRNPAASRADYQPGDWFEIDSSAVLYALWTLDWSQIR